MLQIWIRWRQGREGRSQWWRWICGDLIVVADSGSHPPQPEKRQGHLSCKQSYREKKKRKRRDGDRRPKSVDGTFVITRERSRCRQSQVSCRRATGTAGGVVAQALQGMQHPRLRRRRRRPAFCACRRSGHGLGLGSGQALTNQGTKYRSSLGQVKVSQT